MRKEDFDQGVQFPHSGTETAQVTFTYAFVFSQLKEFHIHFLTFSHTISFKNFLPLTIIYTL